MSDKDYIKELFQNELGNHQVKVDPQLWQGVQAQLGNIASTGASGSAAVAGKASFLVKIGVAAAITTATIVTTYVLVNNADTPTENTETPIEQVAPKVVDASVKTDEGNIIQNDVVADNMTSDSSIDLETSTTNNTVDHSSTQSTTNSTPEIPSQPEVTTGTSTPPVTNDAGSNSSSNSSTPPVKGTPVPLEISIEFEKKSNQHYAFSAFSKDAEKIEWDFGDGTSFSDDKAEHVFNESGTFTVTAFAYRKDEVVKETLSLTVDVVGKITKLPTIFTPNNDGSNDEFFIESEGLLDFSIVIMNDKGEVLFESNSPDFRWDGRDRKTGLIADNGFYFYIITAKDMLDNTISQHQRLQLKK